MFKVDMKKLVIRKNEFKYGEAEPLIIHFNGDSKDVFDDVYGCIHQS